MGFIEDGYGDVGGGVVGTGKVGSGDEILLYLSVDDCVFLQ